MKQQLQAERILHYCVAQINEGYPQELMDDGHGTS